MRYRPLYSLGNSFCFLTFYLFIYFVVIVMITEIVLYQIQPRIRLTLYNPKFNVKLLNQLNSIL